MYAPEEDTGEIAREMSERKMKIEWESGKESQVEGLPALSTLVD